MDTPGSYRLLGRSGLMITPIGLGCWQFSKQKNFAGKFWPFLEDDAINRIVEVSLEEGINWFDTAELYGKGASEKALASALAASGKKPGDVIISTKWWPMFRTAGNILKTFDDRLRSLEPFPVDLYMVHQPFGFSNERIEMKAMAKLFSEGKIRSVGVSNFSAKKMRNAWQELQKQGIPLACNQVRFNLLDRRIESNGILAVAKELGITIIAYSPLAQGILSGKFHEYPETIKNTGMRKYSALFKRTGIEKSRPVIELVKKLAVKYNVTPSQVALNWLIHFHGEIVVVIPGATKETQAKENAGALHFRLSGDDMNLLDRESAIFR